MSRCGWAGPRFRAGARGCHTHSRVARVQDVSAPGIDASLVHSDSAARHLHARGLLWIVPLAAYHSSPYPFTPDAAVVKRAVERLSSIPVRCRPCRFRPAHVQQPLTKVALAVPLGVILGGVLDPGNPAVSGLSWLCLQPRSSWCSAASRSYSSSGAGCSPGLTCERSWGPTP